MGTTVQERDVIFTFDDGWAVEKFDGWAEYKKLSAAPFHAKGCDIVAHNGRHLWLIEVKDYTRVADGPSKDLAQKFGLKVFDTLGALHALARWGQQPHRSFCADALACSTLYACLSVELPDKGRKLLGVEKPLADIRGSLKGVTRKMGCDRPVVTNSVLMKASGADRQLPWLSRRDPTARSRHHDR